MTRKKREINTSLLDSVTADMLGGDDIDFFQDDTLRVERILLELVRPDPLQPRRVLPDRIYQAFHGNRMTPTQALRELIQTAQLAARQQGRPFNNVLDLLGNPDDESEQDLQMGDYVEGDVVDVLAQILAASPYYNWRELQEVALILRRYFPDLNPKSFGYKSLRRLVQAYPKTFQTSWDNPKKKRNATIFIRLTKDHTKSS
jgi:hypothetical protein